MKINEEETDYRTYRLSWKEKVECVALSAVSGAFVAWLLYRSVFGLFLVIPLVPFFVKRKKRQCIEQRKQILLVEFKDAMQSVAAALQAGYSMENAWKESEREIENLYGRSSYMLPELRRMNAAVKMNEPLEKKLQEFASRTNCEEIESFAEVFSFAKRSGGDFPKIIRATITKIAEKIEVENEIATMIAGKKMEQKVMNFVPAFILCYLNFTSEGFLQPLYGNLFGACFMSAALAIYLAAVMYSEKIMDIRV